MNGVGRGDGDQKEKKNRIFTRETVGMTVLLFSLVILFITITGPIVFGDVGLAIASFFYGVCGYFIYPVLLTAITLSISLIAGKKLIRARWIVCAVFLLFSVFCIVHTATAERFFSAGFSGYLAGCWSAASQDLSAGTGGGVLLGLVCYPARLLLSAPGAYVIFSVLTLAACILIVMLSPLPAVLRTSSRRRRRRELHADEDKRIRHSAEEYADPADPTLSAPADYPPADQGADYGSPTHDYGASYGASYGAPPARSSPRAEEKQSEHDLLFGSSPRESYRNNLIFDRNSAFNRRRSAPGTPRQDEQDAADSSEAPTDGNYPASSYPASNYSASNYSASNYPASNYPTGNYSERYEQEEQQTRPPMPDRRITSITPGSFDRDEGLNYPTARPSGEQPSEPADEGFSPYEPPAEPPAPRIEDPADRAIRGLRSEPDRTDPFSRSEVSDRSDRTDPFSRNEISDRSDRSDPFSRSEIPDRSDRSDPFGRGEVPDRSDRSDPFGRSEISDRSDRTDPFSRSEISDRSDRSDRSDPFGGSAAGLFDDGEPLDEIEDVPDDRSIRALGSLESRGADARMPEPPSEPKPKPKKKHVWKKYKCPDLSLLNDYDGQITLSNEEVGRNSGIIIDTLQRYKINTHVIGVKGGASVTRYDLAMPESGTISMVTRYADELAVYLEVPGVNMYANPAVRGISVEVPNRKRATVGLKALIASPQFSGKQKDDAVVFALGQNIDGDVLIGDITEMTHILVAGTTGSGKSVAIHAMLVSMLYKYSPEELRLILIDPKQTEFIIYEGIPHLMINEIISQPQKAVTALNWACKEMERRYSLFMEKTRSGIAVSKLDEYNRSLTEGEEKLPKIIIVVDEFADLMLTAKKDIEEKVQRLAQKARAAGIHLVLATQRPDATVITGVIKSNLPTRIALSVDSDLNSRIMIDESGAEKLLGKGDMFIKMNGKPRRAQGAYIAVSEIQRVVAFIKENNEAYFDEDVTEFIDKDGESGGGGEGFDGDGGPVNDQYIRALAAVVKVGQASISLIQRKCRVGYNHAGKIIEWMEAMGYISAFEGAKARTVLLTKEEFEAKYGRLD